VVIPDYPADLGADFAADVAAAAPPFVAPTPVVEPAPVPPSGPAAEPTPVTEPGLADKPSHVDMGGWRTGSDYAGMALTGVAIVLGLGVVGLVGYVGYSIFAAIFGALSTAAVGAAGVLPLLLIAGVAFFFFGGRGRGGAATAGASSGVATVVRAPVLVGVGLVRAAASMPGVPGSAGRRARRRGVAGAVAPVRSVTRSALPSFGGQSVDDQSVPAEFTGTTVSSPLGRMFGRAPRVLSEQSMSTAGYAYAPGAGYSPGAGKPQSLLSRVFRGSVAPVAAPMTEVRSTWRARLMGAPATVMTPAMAASNMPRLESGRGFGRTASALFGSSAPSAYFANPGADLGIVGKLRRRSFRSAPVVGGRRVAGSDVPIEWLVDTLTNRWIRRMRTATIDDQVFNTFMSRDGGRCRFCAVGFLWDESDPNGWYNGGTWAVPRWRHRDAEALFDRYGLEFLWNISNLYEAKVMNLKQLADLVEKECQGGDIPK
jgi:hypothetical protein